MDSAPNIVLIGFMGTGKSSVGEALAERLKRPFHDMDRMIERQEGMSVSEIFSRRGEARFRRLEARCVAELSGRGGAVIACGGGVALNPANLEALSRRGIVVCLTADAAVLADRLKAYADRPLLAGAPLGEKIRSLLDERRGCYARADLFVDTSRGAVREHVERIVRAIDGLKPRPHTEET